MLCCNSYINKQFLILKGGIGWLAPIFDMNFINVTENLSLSVVTINMTKAEIAYNFSGSD